MDRTLHYIKLIDMVTGGCRLVGLLVACVGVFWGLCLRGESRCIYFKQIDMVTGGWRAAGCPPLTGLLAHACCPPSRPIPYNRPTTPTHHTPSPIRRAGLHGRQPHLWLPARQDGFLPDAGGWVQAELGALGSWCFGQLGAIGSWCFGGCHAGWLAGWCWQAGWGWQAGLLGCWCFGWPDAVLPACLPTFCSGHFQYIPDAAPTAHPPHPPPSIRRRPTQVCRAGVGRPRKIWLTRHGESQFNTLGKIGGNSALRWAGGRGWARRVVCHPLGAGIRWRQQACLQPARCTAPTNTDAAHCHRHAAPLPSSAARAARCMRSCCRTSWPAVSHAPETASGTQ